MGRYNPNATHIVGQEWVPIRDEDVVFPVGSSTREIGHTFNLETSRVLAEGHFYLNEFPVQGEAAAQTYVVSVYPNGNEDLSGPIRSVIIPAISGAATGDPGGDPFGGSATSFADALFDPSDDKFIDFAWGGNGFNVCKVSFATNSYSQLLTGKRILAVNLLYVAAGVGGGTDFFLNQFNEQFGNAYVTVEVTSGAFTNSNIAYYGNTLAGSFIIEDNHFQSFLPHVVRRMPLGEIDPLWDTTNNLNTSDRVPYNYTSLQRFDTTSANRRSVCFRSIATTTTFQAELHYAALEVIYCEEQRVAVGARAFGDANVFSSTTRLRQYVMGTNSVTMRDLNRNLNPTLTPGSYFVSLTAADVGAEDNFDIVGYPSLNGVRELYTISGLDGKQLNIPFPRDPGIDGEVFTEETTHILPQLTLHTSGGPLTEVHVYGRQAIAPVYSGIYAEAEVDDDVIAAPGALFPWVRYYARRFGDTTQPLVLTNQAVGANTVSLTPGEWDELPEIIDGWKEITLRFTTPPTISSAAGSPDWRWTTAETNAGNRWEVLGAWAPALSGIPSNPFQSVPAPHTLGVATYGGTGARLTWQTTVPPVSGVAADDSSDGVILFAQDMPAVSGFGVSMLSQPVSGIGQNCGLDPCCIPTAIRYNRLTWTKLTTPPASGFGYYELQRMDGLTDWQTIMKATNQAASGFNDYEARVGLSSTYRIRAVDSYLFEGPWSSSISSTVTEPGVTIGCQGGHILIFTSNASPTGGYNLAYSSVWEGSVEEGFTFPEAGDVQLQKMYGRDFVVAFRPLERGGERFSRTVLVQAAAISPPTLGDFRSLRDMAWADVPYICVRDEDGNRWYATVLVPSGTVRRSRQLYMAPIDVIEVTDTPAEVDP